MKASGTDDLEQYRQANSHAALKLAESAARAGVRRFIFISSIKVNGEETRLDRPFTALDAPAPADAYGISKWEAECGLRELAQRTGLEVVIIRPPLVYGPGVKANFLRMVRWVHSGIPLPFGAINNRRSIVAMDNLVGLIIRCIDHPAAPGNTFLVSDGEDLSTTQLLESVARSLAVRSVLVPVPERLVIAGLGLMGKRALAKGCAGRFKSISVARAIYWSGSRSLQAVKRLIMWQDITWERDRNECPLCWGVSGITPDDIRVAAICAASPAN